MCEPPRRLVSVFTDGEQLEMGDADGLERVEPLDAIVRRAGNREFVHQLVGNDLAILKPSSMTGRSPAPRFMTVRPPDSLSRVHRALKFMAG